MDPELNAMLERREHVLGRLRVALIKQLRLKQEPAELDPDTPMFGSGFGLDSLDAVEIVVCLENEFDVHLGEGDTSPSDVRTLNTLTSLIIAAGGK